MGLICTVCSLLQICLWDLRNKKAMVEYVEHNNHYTKLPVYVDERERIVYSGKGIDKTLLLQALRL